jgi:predicted ATP-grasp superfamily ATP-dependent carboligase
MASAPLLNDQNTIVTDPSAKFLGADRLKTIATLLVLAAIAPVCGVFVAGALLAKTITAKRPKNSQNLYVRTVLISGGKMTKALHLARSFHSAGHRVIMTETAKYRITGHRFSNAVDLFLTVPEPDDLNYTAALLDIVKQHGVDVYIPVCSPVASHYDSMAIPTLSRHCEVIHLAPAQIGRVDDKYQFAKAAMELGLAAPKSVRITDAVQVEAYDFAQETRPFILKSIAYDAVRRLDLTFLPLPTPKETSDYLRSLPISEANPWVMQEFIAGREFCTHGTVRDGRLMVHCACASSPFQINYDHLDRDDIKKWVERFVANPPLTGQVSLDFIEAADDGQIYAIECNPRTHSAITLFHDKPELAAAYLDERADAAPLEPAFGTRPSYWLYHEMWRLLCACLSGRGVLARLRIIADGKDAVFDWRDPLPFFMLHHWHIPALLLADLRLGPRSRGWIRIDFNIGKLVQAGGD